MSLHQTRNLRPAAIWAAIILAGAAGGWWNYRTRQMQMASRLLDDARRSAAAFDVTELAALKGTREDAGLPAYAAVKARLRKLDAVDPRVRFVAIFRGRTDTGEIVTLADSAEPGTGNAAPREEKARLAVLPGLQEILRTGQPASDGPLADHSGTWITGYAVIGEAPIGGGAASARDIFGIDIDAAGWRQGPWQAGFQGAFYIWILFGLPWTAWRAARRQHEQREVIRNLSEAMEQSHSAIMIVDLEDRVEYANRGLCQQIGYSRRELIGRKWREIHLTQDAEARFADLAATVRSGRTWEGEWTNRRKDGSVYPVHGVVTPVKHRHGALACFVAVFDDVTETRRREAELREARDAALAGDRAKGQFLATMSHEVRTPLNGIVGFTSLLLETGLSPEQREYVQTIRMSTEALIQLTGDILDFARIESGKLKLDPVACDPRECVEDALDLLAAKAAEKHIELLHRVADHVPAAVVTDGGRLRQVLVNLIGNAVKFTEKGEVEVAVALANETVGPKTEDGGQSTEDGSRRTEVGVQTTEIGGQRTEDRITAEGRPPASDLCTLLFTVRDTGIGIAPENHAKLFRPFSQVDESTTRRYSGTGLGLAICRNLIELMGGTISLESEPGRGATFTFTIRAIAVAPPPSARDLGGMRLGLAVRSAPLRQEIAELLRTWNAEVNATDMPDALKGTEWDNALVEVSPEVAQELASQGPSPAMPPEKTIGLVPISLPNEMRAAMRAHFRLLVNKPVHHDALFSLLTGSRSGSPLAAPFTHFGFRVLVVEDNPVNQRLIQRVLVTLGCKPTLATNGREAIAQLVHHPADFDVVLLDLHMPEMDGLAALREIRSGRAGEPVRAIWIIALTADAREQQRTRALESGLNDYLTKPLNILELETALKKFRAAHGSVKS